MSALAKFKSRYKAETAELALQGWDGFITQDAPDWVQALRRRGQQNIIENGLPTPKLERWKYTNLPAWLKKRALSYQEADIAMDGLTDHAQPLAVALLGNTAVQEMAEAEPAGQQQYGDMMLCDAANAFLSDGFVMDVPAGFKSEKPLNITITGHDESATVTHNFIALAEGADVTVIEYHMGNGTYWHNAVTKIKLAKGACLRHFRMQENSHESSYTQNTHVEVEEGAHYEAFTLSYGGDVTRNQIHVDLLGEEAQCHLNGINMLSRKKNADTTITVEHQAPNCLSKQNYRSVLTDQATGTFQGKVHVHQIAQKTDGYQLSNSLLLSPQATMNTKPELEIYADDVKCSHGATSGCLDNDALFYLQARGIPKEQARNLLIQAFVAEVVEDISVEDVQEQALHIVSQWLSDREMS